MELVLGFGAGMLTLINPCILPVLPIILASALQANRWGPIALASGMSLAIVAVGIGVTAFGRSLGLTEQMVAQTGAVLMMLFGAILLVPRLSQGFATATAGFAVRADARIEGFDRGGLRGQFLGGALLGAVWSPCIGPTLGGAIALASQGQSLVFASAVMASFALGVSVVIIALAYGTRSALERRRARMRALAARARPILGLTFLAVGAAIWFGAHYWAEARLLDIMPIWLQDLSVAL